VLFRLSPAIVKLGFSFWNAVIDKIFHNRRFLKSLSDSNLLGGEMQVHLGDGLLADGNN
jgi:hypothetical protein